MSRGEFADALGVSPATVSTWGGSFPKYAATVLSLKKRVIELEAIVVRQAAEIAKGRS